MLTTDHTRIIPQNVSNQGAGEAKQQEKAAYLKTMPYGFSYVLLDAAFWGNDIEDAISLEPRNKPLLYTSSIDRNLEFVSPYLFAYEQEGELAKWLEKKEDKNHQVLYLHSNSTFIDLYRHLRRFLRVRGVDKKWMFLRFYDPRVAAYIFDCFTEKQSTLFFSQINYLAYLHPLIDELKVISINPKFDAKNKHNLNIPIGSVINLTQHQMELMAQGKQRVAEERLEIFLSIEPNYIPVDRDYVHQHTNRAIMLGITNELNVLEYLKLTLKYPVLLNNQIQIELEVELNDVCDENCILNRIEQFVTQL